MSEFKDIKVERSGKTHILKEYELGLSLAQKVKYLLNECGYEHYDALGIMADVFFTTVEEVMDWESGKTVPTDRNIITVINKYYRFLYEKNNGGIE